jgi:hypothetical protein
MLMIHFLFCGRNFLLYLIISLCNLKIKIKASDFEILPLMRYPEYCSKAHLNVLCSLVVSKGFCGYRSIMYY